MNADTFPWSRDITARIVMLDEGFVKDLRLEEYVRAKYEATLVETPFLSGEGSAERRRREIGYLNIAWFMRTLLDAWI